MNKGEWYEEYEGEWLPKEGTQAFEDRVQFFIKAGHSKSEATTLTLTTTVEIKESDWTN